MGPTVWCHNKHRVAQTNTNTYHNSDGFAMADKVLLGLPAVLISTLNNLCRGARVVHRVCRDNVLAVGRPVQTQDVRCSTTLHNIAA